MAEIGTNLQRIMAQSGLTIDQVADRAGLAARTVRGLLAGSIRRPQARTLHRLAAGLGVPVHELFQNPWVLAQRSFDRQTNPVVDEVTANHPELFEGWHASDFDELYSHFGTGGSLTVEGALRTVENMNRHRDVHRKVAVVLESDEGCLLEQLVETLYQRVVISPEEPATAGMKASPARGSEVESLGADWTKKSMRRRMGPNIELSTSNAQHRTC